MTPKKIGFYLHTSWEFEYPFAVRTWSHADFAGMFALLQKLGVNLVMFWPLTEAMPAPLSEADKEELGAMRTLVDEAHAHGLEFWATFAANVTARPEIAEKPFKERHLYPFRVDVRLDDPTAREAYFAHRAELIAVLDNADAYVTIDGDPGSYPQAQPHDYLEVFRRDRATLDRLGRPDAQLVPWLWSGWGSDWERNGAWQEPLEPLTLPVMELLKTEIPAPWTLLPGRSIREDWANGRTNFELAESAGLVEDSVLLTYEIVEFEPTPPAICLQFADIRRVLREEAPLLEKARGIMANAQQPIMALPNLYLFARGAQQPDYLDVSNEAVLTDLAEFLGGDLGMLVLAWQCGTLPLEQIPADLPQRVRDLNLHSEAAACLPGGAGRYVEILAEWVAVRRAVLATCVEPLTPDTLSGALGALVKWWRVHRYVFSGEAGTDFRLEWTHELLLVPLRQWCAAFSGDRAVLREKTIEDACAAGFLSRAEAEVAVNTLVP